MRHDPAGASIVIMLRSLKLYGMANATEDLVAQCSATNWMRLSVNQDETSRRVCAEGRA